MELFIGIIIAVIGGLFTFAAAFVPWWLAKFRKENAGQHAEGRDLIRSLHDDVKGVRYDVKDVKLDVKEVKRAVKGLTARVDGLETDSTSSST